MSYSNEVIEKKLEENLPSMSPTTSKVMRLANDITISPVELTKVIKMDPVLSIEVLKLVNSSYFALSNQITSLEKAVILLGLNTIKNLALSAAIMSQMKSKNEITCFNGDEFWKHSLGVGVSAKMIAQKRGIDKKIIEDYFIAGLLHDIGFLIEVNMFSDVIDIILEAALTGTLIDAEDLVLEGFNHCKIGNILAKRWKFSENLSDIFLHHHDPFAENSNPSELLLSIYLANIICKRNAIGIVLDQPPFEIDPRVYELLGVDASIEGNILEVVEIEIVKAMEFLK